MLYYKKLVKVSVIVSTGAWVRGIGFRDSSQDVMGIMPNMPEEGKTYEKLLCVQKIAGNAMHQFNPANMIASEGDSKEMEGRPKYYVTTICGLCLPCPLT